MVQVPGMAETRTSLREVGRRRSWDGELLSYTSSFHFIHGQALSGPTIWSKARGVNMITH